MNTCTICQSFGGNANPFYASTGLLGHPAIDVRCGYGTDILSKYRGLVIKSVNVNNAGNEGYTLVAILVDDGVECFEWTVGHLDPCVSVGDIVEVGQKIGTEANHGIVYSGNMLITLAMQKAGNREGSHRHYQKRPVMPVVGTDPSGLYLEGQQYSPYFDGQRYYKVIAPRNGYAGCTNPLAPVFTRTLTLGSSGPDVFALQRILVKYGYLTVEPTAYFGVLTASALTKWQSANGISPFPIFGPKSRQLALRETQPLPTFSGF